MSLKSKALSRAISFALVMSANAALGSGAVFAQDQADADATAADAKQADATAADASTNDEADTQSFDTVVVTGTRIKNQAITASSPVMEIDQEQFKYTGATRVDDLVNQYPQLSPVFDSFENNGATGYPTVDLRGLGPTRTLTLVNGYRMPQGAGIVTDISIVPASLVKRVDILTGGASAVYGSDAVAGVVNFLLDTEFEGVSINFGAAAYQHNNDNKFIQGKESARNFDFPDGDSGFDGESVNLDVAVGGSFADGRGHAMGWATWRKNDPLFQGERDFSACALNAAGTACGGSATNATGNFYVYQPGVFGSSASLNPDGSWRDSYGAPYNYAPINYFQRPDERYTFGSSVKFEINEHFKPFLETMYINRRSAIQVAESGTFFTPVNITCDNPLVGSLCPDLGIDPADGDLIVYVAKRNVEGGPRHFAQDDENFRIVTGLEGDLVGGWSYSASFLYGRNTQTVIGENDLIRSRVAPAILGCPAGSPAGCIPYNVWVPGGVTVEAASALAGTSVLPTTTSLTEIDAYVTGDLGFGLPTANDAPISVVLGTDWREDKFAFTADSISQAGDFTGSGGPSLPLKGAVRVKELYSELAVPLLADIGPLDSLNLEAGYRWSDYNLAGTTSTYKFAMGAELGRFKARGGYNRAIRAPNVANLFSTQQIALFGGSDPCAGATPTFTQAQCVNLGVAPDRYGFIAANPASQYNQFVGGNLDLNPEKANTWTAGLVFNPTSSAYVSLDYYHIKIKDTISTIGAQTILDLCGTTGDPGLCSLIHRSAAGDLWRGSDPATSGFVTNLTNNFGSRTTSGYDLGAGYSQDLFSGQIDLSLAGSYVISDRFSPLAGVNDDAAFNCKGKISVSCQTPNWRQLTTLRYSQGIWSAGVRWRYFDSLKYRGNNGENLSVDKLVCSPNGGTTSAFASCLGDGDIAAQNYIDLSASVQIGAYGELTLGVNNVFDKEPPLVGSTLSLNANAPGGYDQIGRYFFSSIGFKF